MGNSIGARNKAKVMKISGETFKLKTPILARDVIKDYPGHVLLESEAVKRYGIRAKPLKHEGELKPKKIYFLVELPKFPDHEKVPRRARSAVHMSAKDRLECLMLSRRSASDLSAMRPSSSGSGQVQVKIKLPRGQVEKLIEDSNDDAELAERILIFVCRIRVKITVSLSGSGGFAEKGSTRGIKLFSCNLLAISGFVFTFIAFLFVFSVGHIQLGFVRHM